jgi:hypothetical protein
MSEVEMLINLAHLCVLGIVGYAGRRWCEGAFVGVKPRDLGGPKLKRMIAIDRVPSQRSSPCDKLLGHWQTSVFTKSPMLGF